MLSNPSQGREGKGREGDFSLCIPVHQILSFPAPIFRALNSTGLLELLAHTHSGNFISGQEAEELEVSVGTWSGVDLVLRSTGNEPAVDEYSVSDDDEDEDDAECKEAVKSEEPRKRNEVSALAEIMMMKIEDSSADLFGFR